jgi:hypothetical protein
MATYEGGCECGAVRFRVANDPIFVNCCHCRTCQKITGSAFALNAMIETERLHVTAGEDALSIVDGAARCSQCKALMWAEAPKLGERIKFVRVGTLNEGERISPDAHFFVRSRHPWVTIPADVPAFETLPGEGDPPLLSAEAAARMQAALG